MQVRIRFYSFIKFKTGLDEISIEMEEGESVDHLVERLDAEYGDSLVRYLKSRDRDKLLSLFVRDNKILKRDAVLTDGDELKILPAVSGG